MPNRTSETYRWFKDYLGLEMNEYQKELLDCLINQGVEELSLVVDESSRVPDTFWNDPENSRGETAHQHVQRRASEGWYNIGQSALIDWIPVELRGDTWIAVGDKTNLKSKKPKKLTREEIKARNKANMAKYKARMGL